MKYFLLLFVGLSACNEFKIHEQKIENNYRFSLKESQIIEFEIDSLSSFSPYYMQYVHASDSQSYLICQNSALNTVDVYSFENKNLVKRINPNEDRLIVEKITGFYARSLDSIFIFKQYSLSPIILLYKTVSNSYSIREFATINPANDSPFLLHASMTASPSIYLNNKIHFTVFPESAIETDINQLELIYDLKQDTCYYSSLSWPEIYKRGNWSDFYLYCKSVAADSGLVYSWQADHNIYYQKNGKISTYYAKSDFFDEEIEYDLESPNHDKSFIETNQYANILYDSYRKLYYRFAIHGINQFDEKNEANTVYNQPLSVIILDKEFKKIGEKLLPPNKYLYKDSFVGEKGLYISNHNVFNENEPEDKMSFTLFMLYENEKSN